VGAADGYVARVLEALLWGFVASSSLLLGALAGVRVRLGKRPIALLMGFGAGTLISAVSFELASEALEAGGVTALAIGLSLAAGAEGGVGIALVVAVFLSNVPEALASAAAMRRTGRSTRLVVGLWLAVVLLSTAAAGLGYAVLGNASGTVTGAVQAVAAGAILVMLVDSMVPEATRDGGPTVGLVTVLGFAAAVVLSHA